MNFIQSQILIFATIVIVSIIGGKKGTIISTIVWAIESLIIIKFKNISRLQIITLSLSFQIGIIIGVIRDIIIKRLKIKNKGRA